MDDGAGDEAARRERARARAARMVIRKGRVGDSVDVVPVSGAEGMALTAELSRIAWTLSGRALPSARSKPVQVTFVRRAR